MFHRLPIPFRGTVTEEEAQRTGVAPKSRGCAVEAVEAVEARLRGVKQVYSKLQQKAEHMRPAKPVYWKQMHRYSHHTHGK